MFFHIPLYVAQRQFIDSGCILIFLDCCIHSHRPEAYSPADRDPRTNWPLDVGIKGNEGQGSAKGNDGFFEKGLLKAKESDDPSSSQLEVKAVANGHCHGTS